MSMKKIFESFREATPAFDDEFLNEVETREGFRNYKVTMFLKIDKKSNIDVNQVFNKLRAIPGVTTLKPEAAVRDRGSYYLSEVTVKFNTRGMPNRNYIYNILVKQINSEMEAKGIPGTKVYGINWQSFSEL